MRRAGEQMRRTAEVRSRGEHGAAEASSRAQCHRRGEQPSRQGEQTRGEQARPVDEASRRGEANRGNEREEAQRSVGQRWIRGHILVEVSRRGEQTRREDEASRRGEQARRQDEASRRREQTRRADEASRRGEKTRRAGEASRRARSHHTEISGPLCMCACHCECHCQCA